MFEKITLRNSEFGGAVTAGHIAEALLYHQNIHLLLNRGSITDLSKSLGSELFLELLERPEVAVTYIEQIIGTHTNNNGLLPVYDWGFVEVIGDQDRGRISRLDRIADLFQGAGLSRGQSKKAARRFLKVAEVKSFSGDHFVEGGIAQAARLESEDLKFFKQALSLSLANELEQLEFASDFEFDIYRISSGFVISDNVDWVAVNDRRNLLKSGRDDITRAHLVSSFVEAIADLHISSHYGGEYISVEASSKIARLKYARLLNRLGRDTDAISEFQDAELDNGRAIRNCINSGDRTFAEFLRIIDKRDAEKFKGFWAGVNPDANALKEYYEENSRQGWITSLPSTVLRVAICTTVGVFNMPAGVALSIADARLTERLVQGWRPHHFVQNRLRPFVS
ncbi:MAG: hypothetical protein DHS20C05_17610 [Hyphococcus sp.]|nr:MAG: hypothetical protein DHS20C05_17610 [Marinicaulis sp.]